jgi:hypothetical protein
MGHSDYCWLLLRSTNLVHHLAVRKTMSRTLLTVVLVVCFAAATPASATAPVQVRSLAPDALSPGSEIASRKPLQPAAEPVMVVAAGIVPERPGLSQSSVDSRPSTDKSGWRTYGTLLAPLVLMAAIALRRNKGGRP